MANNEIHVAIVSIHGIFLNVLVVNCLDMCAACGFHKNLNSWLCQHVLWFSFYPDSLSEQERNSGYLCVPESCHLGVTVIAAVKHFCYTLAFGGGFALFKDEDKNSELLASAHSRLFCFVSVLFYVKISKSLCCLQRFISSRLPCASDVVLGVNCVPPPAVCRGHWGR